jgi:general secretion pathway protein J
VIEPSRQPGGFTLLELLVALALLVLLTTVLLAGVRFETKALSRQSERLDRSGRVPIVFDFLRSHLSNARPVLPINSTGTTIVFEGRAGDISFVDASPQSEQGGGLYLFRVDFANGQLRARWRPFEGTLPVANAGGDSLLLDGVASARFAYYGILDATSGPEWHDHWRGVSVLPLAVRLELVFTPEEHAPALIIAPRLRPLRMSVPPSPTTSAVQP